MELAIPGPPSVPLLGNALDMLGVNEDNIFGRLQRLAHSGTPELSRISLGNHLIIIVNDPDLIARVSMYVQPPNASKLLHFKS